MSDVQLFTSPFNVKFNFSRLNHLVTPAVFKQEPADFFVEEILPFELTGEGEHLFVNIEKTLLATLDVQFILSKWANIPVKHVSYSGLKDKFAVTKQWFSLYLPGKENPDVTLLEDAAATKLKVLHVSRHEKKLRTGAHKENFFNLLIRDVKDKELLNANLRLIGELGVPNYFGEQRFGHQRNNLNVAFESFLLKKRRLKKPQRSICLSSVRSFIFNEIVSKRVDTNVWQSYQIGDVVQLQGSNSFFMPDEWNEVLEQRLNSFDINLTAPLYGAKKDRPGFQENVSALEKNVLQQYPQWVEFLETQAQLRRRSIRLILRDLDWEWISDSVLNLRFYLPAGGFATAVLREIICVETAQHFQRL